MLQGVCLKSVLLAVVWIRVTDSLKCYSCSDISNASDCLTLTQCADEEECYTGLSGIGNNMAYNLGCLHSAECTVFNTPSPIAVVGRQLVEESAGCNKCCAVDFCNGNLCNQASQSECTDYLVSGQNGIPDKSLTASSVFVYIGPEYCTPNWARLNMLENEIGKGAWSASVLDTHQWIQAHFHFPMTVKGIAIQGRDWASTSHQYVTEFRVSYSTDCITFRDVSNSDGTAMLFTGNYDTTTIVTHMLPTPITAVCVRLNPTQWHEHISLRWDIVGC